VQLEWLTSTPWPNSSLSSFSTPSSAVRDKPLIDVDHLGLNKIKKPLIDYPAAVCLKELNADKEAAATTVAREETAQQTETAALSMQVNPQAPPSSDVPVHLMIPSLSAPLPETKGRFCTPLKDPG